MYKKILFAILIFSLFSLNFYAQTTKTPVKTGTAKIAKVEAKKPINKDTIFGITDVNGHWAEKEIQNAYKNKWASNYKRSFYPDEPCSRQEASFMLIEALKNEKFNLVDSLNKAELKFKDTSKIANEFKDAVSIAVKYKLINGYPTNEFKPNNLITRAEWSVILSRIVSLDKYAASINFKDKKSIASWADFGIRSVVELGVIKGYKDNTFKPNSNISKAEVLVMIARILKKDLTLTKKESAVPSEFFTLLDANKGMTVQKSSYSYYLTYALNKTTNFNLFKLDKSYKMDFINPNDPKALDGLKKVINIISPKKAADIYKHILNVKKNSSLTQKKFDNVTVISILQNNTLIIFFKK